MFVCSDNIEEVEQSYPSAAHIEPVEGGFMVFPTLTDYAIWKEQV